MMTDRSHESGWRSLLLVMLLALVVTELPAQVPDVGPGRCYPSCSGPGCACGGCPGCSGTSRGTREWSDGVSGGIRSAPARDTRYDAALEQAQKAREAVSEGYLKNAITYYEWAIVRLPWGFWDGQRSSALKKEWKEEIRKIKASLETWENEAKRKAEADRAAAKQQESAHRMAAKYAASDRAFQDAAAAWRLHEFQRALQCYNDAERALPPRLFDWSDERRSRVKLIEDNRKLLLQAMAAAKQATDSIGEDELDDLPLKPSPGGSSFVKGFFDEFDDIEYDPGYRPYAAAAGKRDAGDREVPRLAKAFAGELEKRPALALSIGQMSPKEIQNAEKEMAVQRRQDLRLIEDGARSLDEQQVKLEGIEKALSNARSLRDESARKHASLAAALESDPRNRTLQRDLAAEQKKFDAAQRQLDQLDRKKNEAHAQTVRLRDDLDNVIRGATARSLAH